MEATKIFIGTEEQHKVSALIEKLNERNDTAMMWDGETELVVATTSKCAMELAKADLAKALNRDIH